MLLWKSLRHRWSCEVRSSSWWSRDNKEEMRTKVKGQCFEITTSTRPFTLRLHFRSTENMWIDKIPLILHEAFWVIEMVNSNTFTWITELLTLCFFRMDISRQGIIKTTNMCPAHSLLYQRERKRKKWRTVSHIRRPCWRITVEWSQFFGSWVKKTQNRADLNTIVHSVMRYIDSNESNAD